MFVHHGLQSRILTLHFGRRQPFIFDCPEPVDSLSLNDDARLFLTTFVSGLLFMTIYLA